MGLIPSDNRCSHEAIIEHQGYPGSFFFAASRDNDHQENKEESAHGIILRLQTL